MPMDVDYVVASRYIARLQHILDHLPHGSREEIADQIIDFVNKMEERWGPAKEEE